VAYKTAVAWPFVSGVLPLSFVCEVVTACPTQAYRLDRQSLKPTGAQNVKDLAADAVIVRGQFGKVQINVIRAMGDWKIIMKKA
jgi:hypothetical protein